MARPETQKQSSIAAIILAAGASHRFGKPKQLLLWKEENFVNTCAETARLAKLTPIIVVLGANASAIKPVLKENGIHVVVNPDWKNGQSSSVKAGLAHLMTHDPDSTGTIFLMADQPHTPVALLEALKEIAETQKTIIAPRVEGQLVSPVYFPRTSFENLMELEGNQGGRAVFQFSKLSILDWHDARQALDIDTVQDYNKLRGLYGIDSPHQV